MLRACFVVLLGCACGLLQAVAPEKWFDKPLSPRTANYRIEAVLDWDAKALQGRETLTWRNPGTAATAEFPLHLYMNAFKGPNSIFLRERGPVRGRIGRMDYGDSLDWGYCQLHSVGMDGKALTGHYGEDETVYWVRLPRPIAPGESIHLDIAWETRFPRVVDRSGWGGYFLMGAQWFPKVGVYLGSQWNCHAYHATTEFFSDFGTYDVEISAPNRIRFAHTGMALVQKDEKGVEHDAIQDPKRAMNLVWKLHAEDVHDFAWAAWTYGQMSFRKEVYRGVEIYYFYQPSHLHNLRRQHEAVKAAIRSASEWYFPYPYPVLTVVDVPEEAVNADGMEYPTLIAASSARFDPLGIRLMVEDASIHETGHQYFYGILASNEVEETWLDEGITNWFTQKVLERTYHSYLGTRRFHVGTDMGAWFGYWMDPFSEPLDQIGFKTRSAESYDATFYGKGALVLNQLEAMLGRPVMEQVMRAYAEEMKFKHPTRQDFKRIAERVSGRDLGAFWRDFMEGTEVLDYAIDSVKATDVLEGGWMESGKGMVFAVPQPARPGRRGSITLVRRGGIRVPLTLWVRLEDRSEQRLTWDGLGRWTTFEFESPVVAAVLDPDGNYPMLKDRLHASYTAKITKRGFHYWSQMVWGALTGLLQGVGLG